ncbi:hypothetical protein LY76DRAFT_590072 [Colletotrichum caudatum]|nr:hypothetical protein LY76DRAFT_590072 [Colletotrichum caudatum]
MASGRQAKPNGGSVECRSPGLEVRAKEPQYRRRARSWGCRGVVPRTGVCAGRLLVFLATQG